MPWAKQVDAFCNREEWGFKNTKQAGDNFDSENNAWEGLKRPF
jgi:hypothetical protein